MAEKEWKNRIVGSGEESLDDIMFNPANWRTHPKSQQEALQGVLDEVGWVQNVIINRTTGHLVDGHLRCQVAAKKGEKTIPVVYVELTPEEESLVLVSLDPIAAMAASDKAKLDELMRAVQSDDERVQAMISEIAEREELEYGKAEPLEDVEPQIDKAEELRVKWGVESRQLWQLGEHRLICGDCTDKAVVERVMGGEVGLVLSDPPYGIEIVQNNSVGGENLAAVGFYSPVIGDETTETSKSFYRTCIDYGFVDFVIWGGNYFSEFLPPKPCWVIWDKRGDIASNNFADCEMAWTSKDAPARIHKQVWMGMIKEREHGKRLHPTQKPIELMEFCINLFGAQIIYDGFLGSGTTLIACERLGRKCRAVEISPAYVAVAIQRWVDVTGGEPVMISTE